MSVAKRLAWILVAGGASYACAGKSAEVAPQPTTPVAVARDTVRDTVKVRDPELEQRAARLDLQLLDREAQIEALQGQLNEARMEVVRAMAKLQTQANRAEAASGMAEAEVATRTLKAGTPEATQAAQLLGQSSAEFNKGNYAGALYLANQAKRLGSNGQEAGSAGTDERARPGETAFAVPVRLKALKRTNVREGPGPHHKVVFTVQSGLALTGYAYSDTWVRVSDDNGRSGWVSRSLVGKAGEGKGPR